MKSIQKDLRPDPDALLKRLHHEEQKAEPRRGKLKIFIGAAAGVGKTFQMLEEAHALKNEGVDIVVAFIETHGRAETEALLHGQETISRLRLEHGQIVLEEMDLDGVLARHLAIALVDELAPSNAPGTRNVKRSQDVEELLDAGISVYTTMNIQHVESLNDIVYQITGVRVRETVPDRIMQMADELEVVDLPPEELLARFSEGKVYIPPQAEQAIHRFFRKGNLLGLREMALRYTASKVDEDMRSYMERHGILGPWPAGSRILVCISTSELSMRLVRIGQRMAADQNAEWYAVYVESPEDWPSDEAALDRLAQSIRLAENLGAKVQTLSGRSIAGEILSFARSQNVTLLVVGLPRKSFWKKWPMTSTVNELIRQSGPIHVLVIGSTDEKQPEKEVPMVLGSRDFWPYYGSVAIVAVVTAFCWTFQVWLGLINVAMILLLPVVYSGISWGRRSGLIASIFAVVALDFFFVPPRLTLAVEDLRYLPMFLVFVIVGVATSFLADLVRWQGEGARQRERFVSSLYAFSRDLMATGSQEELLHHAAMEINDAFQCEVLILLPGENGLLQEKAQMGEHVIFDERKLGVATWVYQHSQPAGHGTQTLSSATFLYLPLKTKDVTVGVLGVGLGKADKFLLPEQRRLLEAFTNILALAIIRSEGHT
ncbi:Osmosensitive K+ channel His kinase sensor domain protein [uncultured archaeon]|nr:Osmosensitive K+ channel His kinase sensor domain protein [uncultured archaeon]